MKKICMIVPGFEAKGGIASVVKGYRGSELEKKYNIHYIETYCDGSKFTKLLKAIRAYACFIKELIMFRPDLLHIHSSFGASFYRKLPFIWAGALLQIPVVNHVHGADWTEFYTEASRVRKAIIRKSYRRCSDMVALSQTWHRNLCEVVDEEKIHIVHNYGPTIPETVTEQPEPNTVLFLGFLCERKGCFDIPEIISLVKAKRNNVRFILAGSGNEADVAEINARIRQYQVQDHVIFPGWVKDSQKEELLKRASLFFLPSYAEGMPMSILEAMGAGLPVVSSNVGGIPQLVEQGKNGYLCEPGDVQAFADAIVHILKDEEIRSRMGKKSLNIMKESYTLDAHTAQLGRIYDVLL